MLKDCVFTSESVNDGHPDKVCDQISDAVLDALLAQDPDSRVACESLIKTGLVVVAGEITSKAKVEFGEIAKQVIRDIGYTSADSGFNCDSCTIVTAIAKQTPHTPEVTHGALKEAVLEEVVKKVVPPEFLDKNTVYFINPTGRFEVGGPQGDCGLTGRKIIVDTYGGYGRHGGGAFSGKDPSKVDRSAAYMARYIAKNIVAAELARTCEVQVAYAIGVADPVSVAVDTFGTGAIAEEQIARLVREHFDLKPAAIIETLGLKRPIYRRTASYGHFGRVPDGM